MMKTNIPEGVAGEALKALEGNLIMAKVVEDTYMGRVKPIKHSWWWKFTNWLMYNVFPWRLRRYDDCGY